MTRAVLIDAGGVLFNNISEDSPFLARLAQRHGVGADELFQAIEAADHRFETDERHVHDVLAECLRSLGNSTLLDRDALDQLYISCVRAAPVAFGAVRELRARHPELVLALANNEAKHWDDLKHARFGHFDLFDVLASSWRMGAVKPSTTFLSRAGAACGCRLEDVTLVDDNLEVIEAARQAGVRALHVATPDELPLVLARIPGLDPQDR